MLLTVTGTADSQYIILQLNGHIVAELTAKFSFGTSDFNLPALDIDRHSGWYFYGYFAYSRHI
jgi:hypothetical protein